MEASEIDICVWKSFNRISKNKVNVLRWKKKKKAFIQAEVLSPYLTTSCGG